MLTIPQLDEAVTCLMELGPGEFVPRIHVPLVEDIIGAVKDRVDQSINFGVSFGPKAVALREVGLGHYVYDGAPRLQAAGVNGLGFRKKIYIKRFSDQMFSREGYEIPSLYIAHEGERLRKIFKDIGVLRSVQFLGYTLSNVHTLRTDWIYPT